MGKFINKCVHRGCMPCVARFFVSRLYAKALYGVTTHGADARRFPNRAAAPRVAATNALVSRHA